MSNDAVDLEQGTPNRSGQISVAMATYNGANHLSEQLESLAAQTELPLELVVTDDGSTDATLSIVEAFAHTAPFPVHVHRNAVRLNYANNFLRAAQLCVGEFVAFCDQDDVWQPQKLEVCSAQIRKNNVQLIVHTGAVWDGKQTTGERYPDYAKDTLLGAGKVDPCALVPGFAMVFRRSLLTLTDNEDRPWDIFGLGNGTIMAHDGWVYLLGTSTGPVALVSEPLVLYRQHATNAVGAPKPPPLSQAIRRSASTSHYRIMAELESKAAGILEALDPVKVPQPDRLKLVARRFRYRARLHLHRAGLYDAKASAWARIQHFGSILLSGGYLPDATNSRLGPRSALKDLLFGVPGLYKRQGLSTNSL